jgi:hypothetical protein
VVKIDDRDAHALRDEFKVVVVKGAHLATFVLAFTEELFLCVLKGSLKEKLLVLIRTLLCLSATGFNVF